MADKQKICCRLFLIQGIGKEFFHGSHICRVRGCSNLMVTPMARRASELSVKYEGETR
jgi:hypothetical protein